MDNPAETILPELVCEEATLNVRLRLPLSVYIENVY